MNDPLLRLARDKVLLRQISDYADVTVQLNKSAAFRPIVTMLARARDEAAIAMVGLVVVSPTDTNEIMRLQNEARRFDDFVKWVRKIIAEGTDADKEIDGRGDTVEDVVDYIQEHDPDGLTEVLGTTERNDYADA